MYYLISKFAWYLACSAYLQVFETVAYMRLWVYTLPNVLEAHKYLEQICKQTWLIKECLGNLLLVPLSILATILSGCV